MSAILLPLAGNLIVLMLAMIGFWLVAVRLHDVSFIDALWAYGMGGLALFSAWRVGWDLGLQAKLLLALTLLWSLRLGSHLWLRWRELGPDPRYTRILGRAMEAKRWNFALASLLIVFLLQGPLLWFVSLPAQVGILDGAANPLPLSPSAWAGAGLAIIGIGFESIGDWQLRRFRADPASKGQVLDTGLWRYTRHPNYFGDACTWWGIWLVAASTAPMGIYTIFSPILLTWMLMRWSGKPILEGALTKSRPGYADYVARTSGFFPWPPKAQ